jgi:hypothetical protein
MKFPKFAALTVAAALTIPAAALAQDTGLVAGATVYGPQGNEVGTIEKIDAGNVVINTGEHSAALPGDSFGTSEKGPTLGLTKAQLVAAIEASMNKQDAALDAALVAGAALLSSDGLPMGTIKSVSEEGLVTVDRPEGMFALDKGAFAMDGEGLVMRMTKADLEAALSGNSPAAE